MPSVRKLPPEEIEHEQSKGVSQRQQLAAQYDTLLASFAIGDWGDAVLAEGESRITVRARLVAAARRQGLSLSFKRSRDNRIRFQVVRVDEDTAVEDGAVAPPEEQEACDKSDANTAASAVTAFGPAMPDLPPQVEEALAEPDQALTPAASPPPPRRAERRGRKQPAPPHDDDVVTLFDGSVDTWRMSTISNQPPGRNYPGRFVVVEDRLEAQPGNDIGLYWCTVPVPPDFILTLEWLRHDDQSRSGVAIRFPDPTQKGYNNTAYVAVDFGFTVHIGQHDGPEGAIYGEVNQVLTPYLARPAGEWNVFEIRAKGQTYTVFLNGAQITQFQNYDPGRGLPTAPGAPSFIGLQIIPGQYVAFRAIRIKPL